MKTSVFIKLNGHSRLVALIAKVAKVLKILGTSVKIFAFQSVAEKP